MKYLIVLAPLAALAFVGVALAVDTDGDGWDDAHEDYLGSDETLDCPDTSGINPAWPPDMNNDRSVDITDIQLVGFWFGRPVQSGAGGAPARVDVAPINNPDHVIDITDILMVGAKFGHSCTP